ncbi:hypothetical protein BGZ79_005816 [Entomortierella chlamydospora]|nr:hypothetical protein BGZ79_005816 [Entomortierella chlamydospora]
MGEISNKRRRSLSRGTQFDSDIDLSDDEDYTGSDDSGDSEYSRYRQRSRSRRRSTSRKKKRRYTYISSDSEEGQGGILQSDTIVSRSSPRASPDSVMANDPSDRFSRPMEMIIKMNSLMDKCSLQMELLNSTFRKMEAINKRFNIEMWEMRKELKSRVAPSTHASQSAPEYPQGEHQMGFQRSSSVSRSRNNSSQSENVPPITANKSESQRTVNPIPPPPSLQPAPPKKRAKTDEVVKEGAKTDEVVKEGAKNNGMVTIRVHPSTVRDAYHLSPTWRSTGYRRVFETSHYQVPIASQPTLGVFSILNKKVIEKAVMGKAPRPMKFNPFSHQTQFEGIAATCSVDGSIQFWNINTREMVLSLPARGTRIFPYTETLTWVSEDTIVAVSHLRLGSSWPEVPLNVVNVEPTLHPLPETQTNLITLYFNPDGKLGYRVVNITSKPHEKTISAVTAVMREDHSMSYITGGCDRALYHWKFHARSDENQSQYEPEGLRSVHKLHSNAISSVAYSHISKNLYSGGKDCRYICFSLEHEKVVKELKLGYIIHINQNPVDPRISAVTLQSLTDQYMLMDERTPGHQVLRLGYTPGHKPSKITHPSWHPEGGLFCSGTDVDGVVNVWDIRWSGIKNTYHQRPGSGIVTGDVQFDRVITGSEAPPRHPIFRKRLPTEGYYRSMAGGPSQILELGGKKVLHAGFHPTKNVMIALNSDSSLTFMDYVMRTDPIA